MRSFAVVLLGLLVSAARSDPAPSVPGAAPAAAAAELALEARWVAHRVEFDYLGLTTYYTCDSLRDKLIEFLRAAGARRDLKVWTSGCSFSSGAVSPIIHARMEFRSLSLAPAEPSAPDAPAPAVPSHWTKVRIADRKPLVFSAGDCELMEQLRDRVLKALEVRNVRSDIVCIPHQMPAFNRMTLSFEALTTTRAAEEESMQLEKQPKKRDDTMKSERK
jgi:hypothetical protein